MSRMGTHGMLLPSDKMVLTVIIMAMLQQIAQTKSHHQAHQQDTWITLIIQDDMINHYLRVTTEIDTIIMNHHLRVTIMIAIIMTIGTCIGIPGTDPTTHSHSFNDLGISHSRTCH